MKYNFKVNPKVFKIFVNDATDEEIQEFKENFQEFRINSNEEETLAYWFVGDGSLEDEKEEYELALKAFEEIRKYEIK